MTNAERILGSLDRKLNANVDLTLYGRAALTLGFPNSPREFAISRDVDAVLWIGQAEDLNKSTNFWEAADAVNAELAEDELYISHFFVENQVILLPDWRGNRVPLPGRWEHLRLHRLGNVDLVLSKLMRDDPIDHVDAKFIVESAAIERAALQDAIGRARIPDSEELREQFARASARLLATLAPGK